MSLGGKDTGPIVGFSVTVFTIGVADARVSVRASGVDLLGQKKPQHLAGSDSVAGVTSRLFMLGPMRFGIELGVASHRARRRVIRNRCDLEQQQPDERHGEHHAGHEYPAQLPTPEELHEDLRALRRDSCTDFNTSSKSSRADTASAA